MSLDTIYEQEEPRGRGRPTKGYETMHVQVPPETKAKVDQLAEVLECSQGEVVAAAVKAYILSFKPKGTK